MTDVRTREQKERLLNIARAISASVQLLEEIFEEGKEDSMENRMVQQGILNMERAESQIYSAISELAIKDVKAKEGIPRR